MKTMRIVLATLLSAWCCGHAAEAGAPVVFWGPDSVEPGDTVLLYGGGLGDVRQVKVRVAPDGQEVVVPTLQPSEGSLKFILPATLPPGQYAAEMAAGRPWVLNRPEVWFLQPVTLLPGMRENQAAAGTVVQIIGRNILLPGDRGTAAAVLRGGDGREHPLAVTRPERFSLRAQLPADCPPGRYELRVGNGFGGVSGWSPPLAIEIKVPDAWPTQVFDVKALGAKGDGVQDDTAALRAALAAAEKNGGGIVYLPWGTYRVADWLCIPERTILRGEGRDCTIIQWPVDDPKTDKDFTPAAIYGISRYAVEDLTLIARKVDTLFKELGDGRGGPAELKGRVAAEIRDVAFRRVNLQHWLLCGHPERVPELWNITVKPDGKVQTGKYANGGGTVLEIRNVTNFELSGCQLQGGMVKLRNLRHARETGNEFSNGMGYCWAEMGGGVHHMISEGNDIRASSSWGYGNIGMEYVYAAHNRSWNFVRGEREAMTLDISALPTPTIGNNIAWFGPPAAVDGLTLTLEGIKAKADEFAGLAVMILDGPGAGQYRVITANTPTAFTVDRVWDVPPTRDSIVGLWQLLRHMIVYKSEGWDTSAFSQLYGSFYDFTIDSCRVERNQGLWGQSGWFVRFCYNDVAFANSYHPGIGPPGNNPEKRSPFSFVGLDGGNLRITKFGSAQYGKPLVFVNEVTPRPVPGVRGAIVKGNVLRYNQRVAFPPSSDTRERMAGYKGPVRMWDVVVDGNRIEHSSVGIQIGGQARGVVVSRNRFTDVADPYLIARPDDVQVIEAAKDR